MLFRISLYIFNFCCKIGDALLKKGTKEHVDGWDA
jgi:hypothetical protein